MERFWLAVGRKQGVQAREIVGSIANEAGIEGQFIGSINIFENYSTVDLPEGMPKPILKHLKKTRVKGTNLGIVRVVDCSLPSAQLVDVGASQWAGVSCGRLLFYFCVLEAVTLSISRRAFSAGAR